MFRPLMLKGAISCIFASCVLAMPFAVTGQSSQEAEMTRWVNEHYDQVVGDLLPEVPKEVYRGVNLPRNTQWILSVRVYDPLRPGEYWFSIRKNFDNAIGVTIRVPEGKPICTQLGELWQATPNESAESLSTKVRLKEYNWTSDNVPELRKFITEFASVKIAAEASATLWSDPVVYHFWTMSRSGNEMRVTTYGPEPLTHRRPPNALIRFVEDFRKFMDKQIQTESARR
jgi:hypothetical protein